MVHAVFWDVFCIGNMIYLIICCQPKIRGYLSLLGVGQVLLINTYTRVEYKISYICVDILNVLLYKICWVLCHNKTLMMSQSVHAYSFKSERTCYWKWKLNGLLCSMFMKYLIKFFGYHNDGLTGQGLSYFSHF